jgi:hypothetical protein
VQSGAGLPIRPPGQAAFFIVAVHRLTKSRQLEHRLTKNHQTHRVPSNPCLQPNADAIGLIYAPNQNSQPWNNELIRFGRLASEDLNIIEHIHMNTPWETAPAALPAGGVYYARYYMVLNSLGNIANSVPELQVSKKRVRFVSFDKVISLMSICQPVQSVEIFAACHPLFFSICHGRSNFGLLRALILFDV